jgi:Eukaryotic and archaeal DNA primase, large subunit
MHPKYTYEVITSTEITPVHIQADKKVNDKRNQERLKTSDFIQDIIINIQKVLKVPIQYNRENEDVLDINNNITNKNQAGSRVAQTVAGISWLVGRADIFGEQQSDGGYRKVLRHLDTDVLEAHVAGNMTVGSYQIREDDTVRWVAIDIDCHNGNDANRAEDERAKAEWILDKYKIPFILEASGSPHSYHIWIILSPTKTRNAYRFIRQIVSEADIDCEVFPKQKSNDKTKYGNLIKLPYGKNLKNSNWSSYIDPDTDERIPCPATPPGIVRLLEVPKNVKAKSKAVASRRAGSPRITANSELDYCMTEALKGVTLTGSAGHNLRVAIVTKAVALGWTEDRICDLFRAQPDFSEEFTRVKIREIAARDYHPYSCETLRDQCGSLVGEYCAGCRFKPKDVLS